MKEVDNQLFLHQPLVFEFRAAQFKGCIDDNKQKTCLSIITDKDTLEEWKPNLGENI